MTTFLQHDGSKLEIHVCCLHLDEIMYRSRYNDFSQQLEKQHCFLLLFVLNIL